MSIHNQILALIHDLDANDIENVIHSLQLIIEDMVDMLGNAGPRMIMAALFVLTSVFSQFISNTATTVL